MVVLLFSLIVSPIDNCRIEVSVCSYWGVGSALVYCDTICVWLVTQSCWICMVVDSLELVEGREFLITWFLVLCMSVIDDSYGPSLLILSGVSQLLKFPPDLPNPKIISWIWKCRWKFYFFQQHFWFSMVIFSKNHKKNYWQ